MSFMPEVKVSGGPLPAELADVLALMAEMPSEVYRLTSDGSPIKFSDGRVIDMYSGWEDLIDAEGNLRYGALGVTTSSDGIAEHVHVSGFIIGSNEVVGSADERDDGIYLAFAVPLGTEVQVIQFRLRFVTGRQKKDIFYVNAPETGSVNILDHERLPYAEYNDLLSDSNLIGEQIVIAFQIDSESEYEKGLIPLRDALLEGVAIDQVGNLARATFVWIRSDS